MLTVDPDGLAHKQYIQEDVFQRESNLQHAPMKNIRL